jgi:hypothetical protein
MDQRNWRRGIVIGLALAFPAGIVLAVQTGAPALTTSKMLSVEDDLDLQGQKLLSDPAVVAAWEQGEQDLLSAIPNPTPETRTHFKQAAAEITFFGVLNGLNDDPIRPHITYVGRPGRAVRSQDTVAPKGIDENPDSVYRVIPMDGASTYLIRGHVAANRPVVNEFSVLSDAWITVGNLSGGDLKVEADGSFAITVGPDAAAGRPNHIHTNPDANYMTIRDTLGDWGRELPNQMTVQRVAGPPDGQPLSHDALMQKVLTKVKRYFAETVKAHRRILAKPANVFVQPEIKTTDGMLITQAYSLGHFELVKDQALVLTIHPGTAKYVTVPVTNLWGTTMDPVHHASSLNLAQAVKNPDGSFTAIVTPTDPGLANWVDTEGLSEGMIFLRWAAIEGGASAVSKPAVEAKVVALADLAGTVPATLAKVDAAERTRQLAQRAKDYDRRWLN